jgi:hypothetical protein
MAPRIAVRCIGDALLSAGSANARHEEDMPEAHDLRCILAPKSIAVVGASRSSDSIGHQILANLLAQGFTGAVYPVNPRQTRRFR